MNRAVLSLVEQCNRGGSVKMHCRSAFLVSFLWWTGAMSLAIPNSVKSSAQLNDFNEQECTWTVIQKAKGRFRDVLRISLGNINNQNSNFQSNLLFQLIVLCYSSLKGNERSWSDWSWLKSAVTHLLIVYSFQLATAPDCATDVPVFLFNTLPKKIVTPTCTPCAQNLDLHLRYTQIHENRAQDQGTDGIATAQSHGAVCVSVCFYGGAYFSFCNIFWLH